MMEFIAEILKNVTSLLILLSALFALLGIAGKIQAGWVKIDLSKMWQRIFLFIFALIFLFGGIFPVIFPKPPISISLRDMLLRGDGKFEWQWAGQNWIGYIVFTEDKQGQIKAKIDVRKIFKRQKDGEVTIVTGPQVMKSKEEGNVIFQGDVVLHKDHIELKNLVVEKSTFGWIKVEDIEIEGIKVTSTSTEILSASELRVVPAFAGKITYITTEGKKETGDIVLVKYQFAVFPSAGE